MTIGVGVRVALGIDVAVAVRGRGVFVGVGSFVAVRVAPTVAVEPETIAPGTLTCGEGTFTKVLSLTTTFAPEMIPPTSP